MKESIQILTLLLHIKSLFWKVEKMQLESKPLFLIYYSGNPPEKQDCKEDQSFLKRILAFGIEIKPVHFTIQRIKPYSTQ